MRWISVLAATCFVTAGYTATVEAQSFDWKKYQGQTINLLLNNHPWSNAIRDMSRDFTGKTGITPRIDVFNEEQFRARLTTLMQAKSKDIDVFMSLKSREGAVFNKAGWYADLTPMLADKAATAPDYNFDDFGKALRDAETIGGHVVGAPINVEGPLFYWRKDVFAKCGIEEPKFVEDIPEAARKLKACEPTMIPWAARGLRGAVPYALASFVFNLGGSFSTPDGKPGLCQPATVKALEMYADLLKNYGPPGATTHTFTQVIELIGQGRVAMAYESSNEFANLMKFPNRANDLGVKPLPPGRDTGISKPVVIGWGLSVSNYSDRKGPAWTFLQWVTSPEIQTRLVKAGVAPPRGSVFEGPEFKAWASELPIRSQWAAALIELGRTGVSVYQSPTERIPEAREIIGRAVQEAVLGQKSAKDAACDSDRDLEKLM